MSLQLASKKRGIETRAWARAQILKLRGVAERKRSKALPLITTTRELESEALMIELSPPLLSSSERGEGDSTNARVHRVLYGAKQ